MAIEGEYSVTTEEVPPMQWIQRCAASLSGLLMCFSLLSEQHASTGDGDHKEEIYVIRSVRVSRIAPTEYCAQSKTGFPDTVFEDKYVFHPVTTRAEDGAILSTVGKDIASLHACFGKTTDPNLLNFYAEGELAGIQFTGRGKCTSLKADSPEAGLNESTCFLDLGGLKYPYAAGLLTTNTLRSRNIIGDKSDPPGYIQPSIATVRLWRRR
jgi:hypothetical protein